MCSPWGINPKVVASVELMKTTQTTDIAIIDEVATLQYNGAQ